MFKTLEELDALFKNRNKKELIKFFKTSEVPILLNYENNIASDYVQVLHNFSFGTYNLPKAKDVYLSFLFIHKDEIDPLMYGYKDAVDILEEKSTFVFEVFIKQNELTKHRIHQMIIFSNHLKLDMYMSIATFIKPERKEQFTYNTNSIIIDLDVYNTKYEQYALETNSNDTIYQEMKPIFDEIECEPSIYIHSGRGRYLVFLLEDNVNLSKDGMKFLYKETVKQLVKKFKKFGADSKCTDLSRVFHMVSNINTKTKQSFNSSKYNKFYYTDKNQNLNYYETMYNKVSILSSDALLLENRIKLTTLANNLGIHKNNKKKSNNNIIYYKSKNNYNIKYSKVNEQRDIDFKKLLELRHYDIKGYRNIFFHLLCNNSFYLGFSDIQIIHYLTFLNTKLIEPFNQNELINIINYAKRNFNSYKQNSKIAIKYSNKKIVELLDITELEQKSMLQLIDKDIATLRKKENTIRQNKIKSHINKAKNEKKKKDLVLKLNELRYHKLMSNKEIAKSQNISLNTVNKYLGKEPKFINLTKVDIKNQIKKYTELNYSIRDISKMLNVSIGKIQKYKVDV